MAASDSGPALWGWGFRSDTSAVRGPCSDAGAGPAVPSADSTSAGAPTTPPPSWFTPPRVAANEVDQAEFSAKYASAPAVLTGCDVPMHLTVDYLSRRYGDKAVPVEINSARQRVVRLGDFLTFADPQLSRLYLRNLHVCRWFPDEAGTMATPRCFGPNLLADPRRTPGVAPEWRQWFELFVCSPLCEGFPVLHVDVCSIHAFSMQIQGTKRFTFFPPADAPLLSPLPPTRTSSALPTDLDAVDASEFPSFARARRCTVDLRAGDVLYMPAGWWHTASAVGEGVSVTVAGSAVCEGNVENFLDEHADFQAARELVACGAVQLK